MALDIHIDRGIKEKFPLYLQIADGIIRAVDGGALSRGSRLPTVRDLAEQVGVTRVTVHNAYNELRSRGWIEATVGRGTFVAGPPLSSSAPVEAISSEITPDKVMADLLQLSHLSDTRSLAISEPDPQLYPAHEFLRLFRSLEKDAVELFQYGAYQGDSQLCQELSGLLAEKGVRAKPDDIVVTNGVTQGLSMVTAALCERGDKVLVEQPTYLGFLGMLESYGMEPIGVPLDEEGPRLDHLERILTRDRPRFFYTVPSFQNPTGICMSQKRRARLLSLAAEYELMIVEDDINGYLGYDAAPPPPLKANDHNNLVVYLDGFSKVLLPGLRVGFIVPPPALKEKLMSLVRAREMCGPLVLQRTLAEFLRRGLFHEHLKRSLPLYRKRRDALVEALSQAMPEEVDWTVPQGGYCCWVSLPEQGDFDELYRTALSRGVVYTPGEVFLATPTSRRHLRLCFGAHEEGVTREAVLILGDIIKNYMSRPAEPAARSFEPKPIV